MKSCIAVIIVLIGFSTATLQAQYCAAGSLTNGCITGDEYIGHVTFNTINNASACESGMYGNYTGQNTTVEQTLAYTITVNVTNSWSFDHTAVYFDWNQDNDFLDAGETFALTGAAVATGSITIPATSNLGSIRMRVRMTDTTLLSCGIHNYGEVEDYTVTVVPLVPCAGTPAPGNTLSTSNPVCVNSSFTLSLQNFTSGSGITYQWQSSATGFTYTDISGATNATYTTSQTSAAYYQCVVSCSSGPNSTTSNPLQVNMNPFSNCYCTPTTQFGCTSGDYISNVTFAGINNTTGACLVASYSDYRATVLPGSVTVGQTYSFSSSINNGGIEYAGAWIDFDHSSTFDASEYIALTDANGIAPWIYTATTTIPLTALTGTTIMRVRSRNSATIPANSGCSTYTYGETEDYTLTILPGPYDIGVLNLSAPVSPACYTANESVTATVKNFGSGAIDLTLHPVTVSCSVTGTNPITFTNVVLNTGSIAVGGTQSVNFSTTYDMSAIGTYTFTSAISVGGDATVGNDSYTNAYTKYANPTVTATANFPTLCAGSMETLNGGGAVTYVWDNSVLNNVPFVANGSTTYNVTGTDAYGCTGTASVSVTVNPLSSFSQTVDVCAGGSVTVGGNLHTTSGTYVDVITGGSMYGCDSTVTTNLTVDAAITGSQTVTLCFGGSITIGGNLHITNGTYTDVIAAGATTGCDSTVTTNLTVSPVVTGSQTVTLCAGGMLMVGSAMHMASGTFTDVITGGAISGCDSTVTTNLTIMNAITGSQTLTICIGNSITVGTSVYDSTGVYSDVLIGGSAAGCDSSVTTNLTIDQCIGINEITFENNIALYPNPTNGLFTIAIRNASFNELLITITDIQGRVVYALSDKNTTTDYTKQINLSDLAKGIYYIKLSNGTDATIQKLMVQ